MSRKSEIVRRLRKNYCYSLEQLKKEFGLHPQTVRRYINDIQNPLKSIKGSKILIFSEDFRAYLKEQISASKTKLEEHEMYCMSCKKGVNPFNDSIVATNVNKKQVRLTALCPCCYNIMNRSKSLQKNSNSFNFHKTISRDDLNILQNTHAPDIAKKRKERESKKKTKLKPVQLSLFVGDSNE